MKRYNPVLIALVFSFSFLIQPSFAWFDETHFMIRKAAGSPKWFNGAAADFIKIKAKKIGHSASLFKSILKYVTSSRECNLSHLS